MHNPAHPGEVLKELMSDTELAAFAARPGVDIAGVTEPNSPAAPAPLPACSTEPA